MQNATTVLDVLRERGRRGLPLERLYRQLFNPQLFLMAYGHIYANKGAMTPGVTGETVDGMSLEKIDAIIGRLRAETYRWTQVRRTYVPKENGRKHPLGLPTWSDKLVAAVLLDLMVEYPSFGRHAARPICRWRVVIQQRSSPTAAMLLSRCRPSPCDRLSRPPSTTATPPRSGVISGHCACPPSGRLPDEKGDARSLPTFTEDLCAGFGAQLYPGSIATDRTSQSWSGPPETHGIKAAGEERPSDRALSSTAKRPIHQVRQAADDSRDVNHWLQSGWLFLIHSQLARVWIVAASIPDHKTAKRP